MLSSLQMTMISLMPSRPGHVGVRQRSHLSTFKELTQLILMTNQLLISGLSYTLLKPNLLVCGSLYLPDILEPMQLVSTRDETTQKLLCIVGSTPDNMLDVNDGFDDVFVELRAWQIDRIEYDDDLKGDTKSKKKKTADEFYYTDQGNMLKFVDGTLHAGMMTITNGYAFYRGILRAFGFWFDDGEDLDYPLVNVLYDNPHDMDDYARVSIGTDISHESCLEDVILRVGCYEFTKEEIPELFEFLDAGFGFEDSEEVDWDQHLPIDESS